MIMAGGLITGFTVLSAFTATRVYPSEQIATALRGRGPIFGESFGKVFVGVLAPCLMAPYAGSPAIFFGTIIVVATAGAFVPLLFGRKTVGQPERIRDSPRTRLRRRSAAFSSAPPPRRGRSPEIPAQAALRQAAIRPSRKRRSIGLRASAKAARKCSRANSRRPRRRSSSPRAAA